MNSTPKQYQPFMMAEERAARSVFGKFGKIASRVTCYKTVQTLCQTYEKYAVARGPKVATAGPKLPPNPCLNPVHFPNPNPG